MFDILEHRRRYNIFYLVTASHLASYQTGRSGFYSLILTGVLCNCDIVIGLVPLRLKSCVHINRHKSSRFVHHTRKLLLFHSCWWDCFGDCQRLQL